MAKRLIDSAELIAKLPIVEEDKQISLIGAVADAVVMISECQPVDAVEVVRCKDCKYYDNPICGVHSEYPCDQYNTGYTVHTEPDDFCSYGERKEG